MTSLRLDDAFLRHLERLALRARRRSTASHPGDRPSRRVGLGVDFADHRAYAPGDDPRALDWNVYARTDRLVTRQFEATDDLPLTLLVDTSASMSLGSPAKALYSRQIAAAIGYVGLVRSGSVSVHGFGERLLEGPVALRGRGRARALFAYLEGLAEGGRTKLPQMAQELAAHPWHRRHRGLVLLLSDFATQETDAADAMTLLRQRGFEPVMLVVSAPDERDPARAWSRLPHGGELELFDPETQETLTVAEEPELAAWWQARHATFLATLLQQTRRAGVAAVALDTGTRVEAEALRAMHEAGLIH